MKGRPAALLAALSIGAITLGQPAAFAYANQNAFYASLRPAPAGQPVASWRAPELTSGCSSVAVSWQPLAGAAKYEVLNSADGRAFTKVQDVIAPASRFVDYQPQEGQRLYYKVQAVSQNGATLQETVSRQADVEAVDMSRPHCATAGCDIRNMFNSNPGNTWVFTGGRATKGLSKDIAGVRNYVGQFEEYIRWERRVTSSRPVEKDSMQRYTINTASEGKTLLQVVRNFDTEIRPLNPAAVAYLVSREDLAAGTAGVKQFSTQLRQFIEAGLALREGHGFVVVQTPYVTGQGEHDHVAKAYRDAAVEIVAGFKQDADAYRRVKVVDHYTLTGATPDFSAQAVTAEGDLNGLGHLAIGRQLATETIGFNGAGFPADPVRLDRETLSSPSVYLKHPVPRASFEGGILKVALPSELRGEWTYLVEVGDPIFGIHAPFLPNFAVRASGQLTSEMPAQVAGLDPGVTYRVTIRSADGRTQLPSLVGRLTEGVQASVAKPAPVTKLAQKLASEPSLTWLFIGDSITHGALHTRGYDSLPQSVEKYLGQIGRGRDIVVNTAVSGATAQDTVERADLRVSAYPADVVTIMLGTNDSTATTPDAYKAQLTRVIEVAKQASPEAVLVLRVPPPGSRSLNLMPFLPKMREVAQEQGAILVDHFAPWTAAAEVYPWLVSQAADTDRLNQILFSDSLHPGFNGQLVMTRQFLEALGMWSPDTALANLWYQVELAPVADPRSPELGVDGTSLTVNVSELVDATRSSVASEGIRELSPRTEVTVVDKATGRQVTRAVTGMTAEFSGLTPGASYQVRVSRLVRDQPQRVSFAPAEVTLGTAPDGDPTGSPTGSPTGAPSSNPSGRPTNNPTSASTGNPSGVPSGAPIATPSGEMGPRMKLPHSGS